MKFDILSNLAIVLAVEGDSPENIQGNQRMSTRFLNCMLALAVLAPFAVRGDGKPPMIMEHPGPENAVFYVGDVHQFSVAATGTPPLSYEWQTLDYALPSNNKPTIDLTFYGESTNCVFVVVSNPYGSVTSNFACSEIRARYNTFPKFAPIVEGSSASVRSVLHSFPTVLKKWWKFNGTPIPNGTNYHAIIPDFDTMDVGVYSFALSNRFSVRYKESRLGLGPARVAFEKVEGAGTASDFLNYYQPTFLATNKVGGVYFAVSLFGTDSPAETVLFNYASDGALLWAITNRPPTGGRLSVVQGLVTDSNGDVIVSGWEAIADNQSRFTTTKYSPEGLELWGRDHAGGYDYASSTVVDHNNHIFVSGLRHDSHSDNSPTTVVFEYGPDGELLKELFLDAPHNAIPPATLHIAGDGLALHTGRTRLYRLSKSLDILWQKDGIAEVSANAEGEFAVKDWTRRTAKLDINGGEIWSVSEQAGRNDSGRPVIHGDGRVSAGFRHYQYQFRTFEYGWGGFDNDGGLLWVHHLAPYDTYDSPTWRGTYVDEQGNTFAVVWTTIHDDPKYHDFKHTTVNKIDREGRLIWSAGFGVNRSSNFMIQDLVANPSGDVFIVGYEYDDFHQPEQYRVIKIAPVLRTSLEVHAPGQQLLEVGDQLHLGATASGSGDLQFQWVRNLEIVEGATNTTFSIDSFSPTNSGSYSLAVFNDEYMVVSGGISISPSKPTFAAPMKLGNYGNTGEFDLWMPPFQEFDIQSSSNLVDWATERIESSGNHAIPFHLQNDDELSSRLFYRVVPKE